MKNFVSAFFYYPQWLWICTSRAVKLYLSSLNQFPFKLSSIPRFFLVSILTFLALSLSYFHLSIVFIERISLGLVLKPKNYQSVFIVGAPRSGTTRMHKLMAADKDTFTAMKMWELFFAPSIIQKVLLTFLGKTDALIGAPFFKLIRYTEKSLYKNFNKIHDLSIFNVEEDALILFHLFSTYHLSFLLGKEGSYDYLNHDKDVPKAIWAYYKICIDNHMVLNKSKIYLSKNPFFSGSMKSLSQVFNASKFIHMNRDINAVIPSFFSLKKSLAAVFYGTKPSKEKYTSIYKTILLWNEAPTKEAYKAMTIKACFPDLTRDPINLIGIVYVRLNLTINTEYKSVLLQEDLKSKQYKSQHSYSIKEFEIDSFLSQ